VDVLDDECPHEGHPLSMALHREGVLTCQWHNWRFDAGTGRCLVGEESVRRHPVEILHGEVFVAIDAADGERERHARDLQHAMDALSVEGAARSGLRLARESDPGAVWSSVLQWAVGRGTTGPGDALSRAQGAWLLYEHGVLSLAEAIAVLVASVQDALAGASRVRERPGLSSGDEDVAEVLLALAEERVDDAVAMAIGVRDERLVEFVGRVWTAPWTATKLWDGGLLYPRIEDALRCVRRAEAAGDRALARRLLAAAIRGAGFAIPESDLPGWRSTRQALLDARALRTGEGTVADPTRLARDLANSEAQALAGMRRELDGGAGVAELSAALARAAVERLARYDPRWTRRRTVRPSRALDVGASARFAWALVSSASGAADGAQGPAVATGRSAAAMLLMGAGLLGKQRRTSAPDGARDGEGAPASDGALDALRAHVRHGCLRADGLRGEGVALAAALWSLAVTRTVEAHRCAAAAKRAFVEDDPPDLARVAEVAALRVAQDGAARAR
jgi:hypothetical protein